MAETLRTIASSTAKLRELLKDSKKDLHRIRLLLDALDEGLKSLWPFDDVLSVKSTASPRKDAGDPLLKSRDGTVSGVVAQLVADPGLWKETLAIVASGRIIGVAAEADEALAQASTANTAERLWMADGKVYVRWLGKGAVWIMQNNPVTSDSPELGEQAAAQLLGKGMAVGYLDDIVGEVTRLMVLQRLTPTSPYYQIIGSLKSMERRRFLSALLRYLERLLSQDTLSKNPSIGMALKKPRNEKIISATAFLLQSIITTTPTLLSTLTDFMISQPQSIPLVRAILTAIPSSSHPEILQATWAQFADKLHIQHTPILSQEANVCVLLLSAGYVHRADPARFKQLARTSMHNSAVSERLKSSSERVQWLGMCVGMAVSSLVDEEGSKMDFGVDQTRSEEAKLLRGLVNVKDVVDRDCDLAELFGRPRASVDRIKGTMITSRTANAMKRSATGKANNKTNTLKPRIVEVMSDSDSGEEKEDEDGLIPYAKPDADDPDSDEDATVVNRDKPKAPAYIRDLISNLSDTSNAPLHTLALHTAATLIRRKATFGSELHDRTRELAQCLVSLQDQFETEGWHELRQTALVALVIAQPKIMGPWLARTLFEGDSSISQRIAVVTAMGLGGRELAGFKAEDDGTVGKVDVEAAAKALERDEAFPTQRLPGRLHEIYSSGDGGAMAAKKEKQLKLESRKVEALTRKMEQVMLRPASTREISKPRPRTKMLKNDLAALVADYFFFPLTRYWQVYSQASTRTNSPLQSPLLSSLTLKTLSILITAAGPATLSLPQLTKELFSLLLSVRSTATRHPPVMEAVLFALLSLLDIHSRETISAANSGLRWLAEECAGPVVEFREWVGMVWEKLEDSSGSVSARVGLKLGAEGSRSISGNSGGSADAAGDEETERCRVLAASVLVKIREVVDTYQRLLVGELSRV